MNLNNKKAQSIVEYVVMFVVMMIAVIAVFFEPGQFKPASNKEGERDNFFTRMRMKSAFESAVNQAVSEFDKQ